MSNQTHSQPLTLAIFGEVLADIFPDATVLGGAPYNVARHLRAFQQRPLLISRVGHDALKPLFFNELSQLEIDPAYIQLDAIYPTGKVTVHMKNGTHRFEIEADQAYDHIQPSTLATQPQLMYFGTLALRNPESRMALDALLTKTNCPRFLDINLRSPWYNKETIQYALMQADIVKVNDEELGIISNLFGSCSNDQARAKLLMKRFDLQHLFVTCGSNGAWLLSSNGEITTAEEPALAASLVDTVGAGDAFSAVCMIGLLHNWPMPTILVRASTFASALCTIRGAAPETRHFYTPYLDSWV